MYANSATTLIDPIGDFLGATVSKDLEPAEVITYFSEEVRDIFASINEIIIEPVATPDFIPTNFYLPVLNANNLVIKEDINLVLKPSVLFSGKYEGNDLRKVIGALLVGKEINTVVKGADGKLTLGVNDAPKRSLDDFKVKSAVDFKVKGADDFNNKLIPPFVVKAYNYTGANNLPEHFTGNWFKNYYEGLGSRVYILTKSGEVILAIGYSTLPKIYLNYTEVKNVKFSTLNKLIVYKFNNLWDFVSGLGYCETMVVSNFLTKY